MTSRKMYGTMINLLILPVVGVVLFNDYLPKQYELISMIVVGACTVAATFLYFSLHWRRMGISGGAVDQSQEQMRVELEKELQEQMRNSLDEQMRIVFRELEALRKRELEGEASLGRNRNIAGFHEKRFRQQRVA